MEKQLLFNTGVKAYNIERDLFDYETLSSGTLECKFTVEDYDESLIFNSIIPDYNLENYIKKYPNTIYRKIIKGYAKGSYAIFTKR